ncbi:MAG: transcription initiation factor IIB [Candidatus Methanomethylophilaceae archaeon]|nr:transcription initiation factor IIB [Candidatus Methanomethylophilaceae archaeon]
MTSESITNALHRDCFDECCPDCGCKSFMTDPIRGERICNKCGMVIDDSIVDERPEPNYGDDRSQARAHYGMPVNRYFPGSSLSTDISTGNRDGNGNIISYEKRMRFSHLRKVHFRNCVKKGVERNLRAAMGEIDRLNAALGLPGNVHEKTVSIYRRAVTKNLVKGRSIDGLVAASVYAACRQCGVPRTLDEIADHTRIRRKELARISRMVNRALHLKLDAAKPRDFLPRFCSALGLSNETECKARELLEASEELGISSGRTPVGIVAAAIYLATVLSGERRTKKAVSDVAKVTEVTIRNRLKEISAGLGIDASA